MRVHLTLADVLVGMSQDTLVKYFLVKKICFPLCHMYLGGNKYHLTKGVAKTTDTAETPK